MQNRRARAAWTPGNALDMPFPGLYTGGMNGLRSLALIALASLCGCATSVSESGTHTAKLAGAEVLLPKDYDGDGQRLTDLVRVLKKHGGTPTATGSPRYTTALSIEGAVSRTCTITLYDAGVPVVSAKSTNPGFGTWLARGMADENIFNSSIEKFDAALDRL